MEADFAFKCHNACRGHDAVLTVDLVTQRDQPMGKGTVRAGVLGRMSD